MTESFQPLPFNSKLPNTQDSIFSRMTALAQRYEAINLSQGFPDFPTDPKLVSLVSKAMQDGYNQYAPMPGLIGLREKIAAKYSHFYAVDVNPQDEITITAGGTQGLFTAISTVIKDGDEVIIFEPAYDSYRPAIEVFGGKVIALKLKAPTFEIDWEEVQRVITPRTKMIILNNPNNPTSRVLTPNDIRELEDIVDRHNLVLLSDEVYEHIIYDDRKHLTVLGSPVLRQRAFVVCSFGKLLHTTGWKMGYVIAPTLLTAEFRKTHQFNVFSVNTPMQVGIATYLEDLSYYDTLPSLFQAKRDYVCEQLSASKFKVLPSEGTYFMLLDYSAISDENELVFAERITKEHKVATIPVSAFYADSYNQKLLRICFAKKLETLTQAVSALLEI